MWRPTNGRMLFISFAQWVACIIIHCAFRRGIHPAPGSVAGLGVRGPFGPRVGNSSGISPGNSRGCGGRPGSRRGGGTSGRGLPGGFSGGGSVGCPGVAGGISGGSIGITSPEVSTPETTTARPARSSRVALQMEPGQLLRLYIWSRMRSGWAVTTDHLVPRTQAARAGPILLCMGLFSRFCVWALRCTAEGSLRCVRDTRSLVLRTNGESIRFQPIPL